MKLLEAAMINDSRRPNKGSGRYWRGADTKLECLGRFWYQEALVTACPRIVFPQCPFSVGAEHGVWPYLLSAEPTLA